MAFGTAQTWFCSISTWGTTAALKSCAFTNRLPASRSARLLCGAAQERWKESCASILELNAYRKKKETPRWRRQSGAEPARKQIDFPQACLSKLRGIQDPGEQGRIRES